MGAAEGRLDSFCESAFPAVYDSTSGNSTSSSNGTASAAAADGGLVGSSSCATVTPPGHKRACCQAKVAQDEADSYCAVTFPEVWRLGGWGRGWVGDCRSSGRRGAAWYVQIQPTDASLALPCRPPTPPAPLLQLYGALAASCASLSSASRGVCCATKFVADTWDAYCAALGGGAAEVRGWLLMRWGAALLGGGEGRADNTSRINWLVKTEDTGGEHSVVQAPAPAPAALPALAPAAAAAAVGAPSLQALLPGGSGTSGGNSKVRAVNGCMRG